MQTAKKLLQADQGKVIADLMDICKGHMIVDQNISDMKLHNWKDIHVVRSSKATLTILNSPQSWETQSSVRITPITTLKAVPAVLQRTQLPDI